MSAHRVRGANCRCDCDGYRPDIIRGWNWGYQFAVEPLPRVSWMSVETPPGGLTALLSEGLPELEGHAVRFADSQHLRGSV